MSKKPSVKSSELSLLSVPAFWPMATAMMEEESELYARNVKFAEEEIKIHDELRPKLATCPYRKPKTSGEEVRIG